MQLTDIYPVEKWVELEIDEENVEKLSKGLSTISSVKIRNCSILLKKESILSWQP